MEQSSGKDRSGFVFLVPLKGLEWYSPLNLKTVAGANEMGRVSKMSAIVRIHSQEELERCIAIRRDVFIREQKVPEEIELDGRDQECIHFLAFLHPQDALERAVGSARLWIDEKGRAKAQRVAVLEKCRKRGIGQELMEALEGQARADGFRQVWLGAQIQALAFYERIGYVSHGDVYQEAGIDHQMMVKDLSPDL